MSDDYKVAIADVPFGSAYAYRKGDKIEDFEAIERWGWKDYVAAPNTKAAREAQGLPESEKTDAGGKATEKP